MHSKGQELEIEGSCAKLSGDLVLTDEGLLLELDLGKLKVMQTINLKNLLEAHFYDHDLPPIVPNFKSLTLESDVLPQILFVATSNLALCLY